VHLRRRALLPASAAVGAFAAVALIAVAVAEALHHRASRHGLDRSAQPAPALDAVIVLGFRDRGPRAHAVNRYRVRAALRSFDPRAAECVLVLCGGAVAGGPSEAELMAEYARRRGYGGRLRLDSVSTTTRENIANAARLVEDADCIRIASNSLHAERARSLLREIRPDLGTRLRPAADHRFGEVPAIKVVAVARELRARSARQA
jgi:hypothetical protein